jgi:hypothetical protein
MGLSFRWVDGLGEGDGNFVGEVARGEAIFES